MTSVFIKLHGAWSGKPCYVRTSDIVSVGQGAKDLTETIVMFMPGVTAAVTETPDEVMALMAEAIITYDDEYETKQAAKLDAIRERAARKTRSDELWRRIERSCAAAKVAPEGPWSTEKMDEAEAFGRLKVEFDAKCAEYAAKQDNGDKA